MPRSARWWRAPVALGCGLTVVGVIHSDAVGPTKAALITNALPYWGIWHLAAQHFGISAVLRRRGHEAGALTQDRRFFVALFVLGIVHFHAQQELEFEVLGTVARMWRLPIPEQLRSGTAMATAVAYVAMCAVHLAAAWRKNRLRAEYQSWVALATFLAFFVCHNILMTTASITALHNIHYMAFVADYQAGRSLSRADTLPLSRADVFRGLGYSFAVNLCFVVSMAAGEVVLATLVGLHYLVDGRIWHFRRDPSLGEFLGVS